MRPRAPLIAAAPQLITLVKAASKVKPSERRQPTRPQPPVQKD